jgi:L-fucose mutarotase
MLKNLNPLLTPDFLYVLASMGHGDDLVLCDANFPAESVARTTVHGRAVRVPGADLPSVAGAMLTVMPLDESVDASVSRMAVTGDELAVPPVQREVQMLVDAAVGRPLTVVAVARTAFYDLASQAYAVVATGESRLWGCFIFKKGVVPPGP